jgi:hypothetical protein
MSKPIPASLMPTYDRVFQAQLRAIRDGRPLELCADIANKWAASGRGDLADAVIHAMAVADAT